MRVIRIAAALILTAGLALTGCGDVTVRPEPLTPSAPASVLAEHPAASSVAAEPESPDVHRVGWRFVSLYTLAYMSTCLVFLAPALVTLALKVNSLVGIEQAPNSLALLKR